MDANERRVALLAASAGWQARGRRLKAIVPKYKRTRSVEISAQEAARFSKRQKLKEGSTIGGKRLRRESQIISMGVGLLTVESPRLSS